MIRRKIYNTNKREEENKITIAKENKRGKNDEEKATTTMEENKIAT